jgi:predicted phage baseplate assembly protein
MALISPILDNRTFAQLREELVRRIPVYTPEWTNFNESDPGIVLLELFAHLGESLLYRFNQIPETTRIEFLRMLGVQPRPARPAQVLLAATTELPSGVQVLTGSEVKAGSVSFETDDEVYVWPVDLIAAGKTRDVPQETRAGRETSADALQRAKISDPLSAQFYRTTVVSADPLESDPVVVDVSAQADRALWIALVRKPITDTAALGGKIVFVGVAFDEVIDPPVVLEQLDAAGAAAFHSDELTGDPPPMLWRLWNGDSKLTGSDAFQQLAVVGDTTRGMVTSGVVKVELPSQLPVLDGTTLGGPDAPPPLADAKLAAAVIAWIQVSRPVSPEIGDAIGSVRWVGINAVHAVQARTAAPELIGTGTGDGDQRYPLSQRPVLAGSIHLQVEEPSGWTTWYEVDNFVATAPDDRHFMVDHDAGAVSFGRVRVPQIGERIRVTSYRYGGGRIGNVAAGAVNALSGVGGIKVANPLPAAGGGDRVELTEAMDAIPAEVHRHDRAVILDDFRDLAEQVPGVIRAEPLALLHPDNPDDAAAGVISVVIFPDGDLRNPNAPLPELGLLRRTARYLDARRLVTTELYVVPPEYVKISVSVGMQVRDGYQVDAVRRWVELILRQYLSPVPPYGPDGRGWPLGRAIRRAELEAVAVQVEGVEYLEDLLLGTIDQSTVVQYPLIPLKRWQVPQLAEIAVVAGPPLPPGTAYSPAPPDKVPVPLPPDVC